MVFIECRFYFLYEPGSSSGNFSEAVLLKTVPSALRFDEEAAQYVIELVSGLILWPMGRGVFHDI